MYFLSYVKHSTTTTYPVNHINLREEMKTQMLREINGPCFKENMYSSNHMGEYLGG